MPDDGTLDGVAADVHVEVALGDGEIEGGAAVAPSDELRDEVAVEGPELDLVGAMDPLPGELLDEAGRILVGVDGDARRGLARPVQPRCVGGADVDPDAHRTG